MDGRMTVTAQSPRDSERRYLAGSDGPAGLQDNVPELARQEPRGPYPRQQQQEYRTHRGTFALSSSFCQTCGDSRRSPLPPPFFLPCIICFDLRPTLRTGHARLRPVETNERQGGAQVRVL